MTVAKDNLAKQEKELEAIKKENIQTEKTAENV